MLQPNLNDDGVGSSFTVFNDAEILAKQAVEYVDTVKYDYDTFSNAFEDFLANEFSEQECKSNSPLGIIYKRVIGQVKDIQDCLEKLYSNMGLLHLLISTQPEWEKGGRSV